VNGEKTQPITQLPINPAQGQINQAHDKWQALINEKSDSLATLYTVHAIKILENENTVEGHLGIKDYYLNSSIAINSVTTDTFLMANEERGLAYEIGEFITYENSRYKHLIIWETREGIQYRDFEFIAQMKPTDVNLDVIAARRDIWMKLCNQHNAAALINEMYAENTMYFNHKPLITGRNALIKEYQYMNSEDYALALHPIITEAVNDNLVFEIGQCDGSYNGKYIIVWRKNENEQWEIFIDSNI
jgi:ketosteroid isomerase-like protein